MRRTSCEVLSKDSDYRLEIRGIGGIGNIGEIVGYRTELTDYIQ